MGTTNGPPHFGEGVIENAWAKQTNNEPIKLGQIY
jgi:hypothetical protein